MVILAATLTLVVAQAGLPKDLGEPVWQDEFTGSKLDETKWQAPTMDRQNAQSRWDPALVSVRDGNLVLGIKRLAEGEPRYLCGAVRSRKNYRLDQTMFAKAYGYFEARVRLMKQPKTDAWFAFWSIAGDMADKQTDSREGAEIDIVETFSAWEGKVSQAIHWGGYNNTLNSNGFPNVEVPGLEKNGFHTYGVLWTPDEYVFYIDRKPVRRTDARRLGTIEGRVKSQGTCRKPGYLKLTTEATAWSGPTPQWEAKVPTQDEVLVDYVRVWDIPK